ncbi:unnamed protein product, partial [Ectocarpus fasciculatus]
SQRQPEGVPAGADKGEDAEVGVQAGGERRNSAGVARLPAGDGGGAQALPKTAPNAAKTTAVKTTAVKTTAVKATGGTTTTTTTTPPARE